MMAFVNIPRHKTDPGYRYTMPKIICRTEGRGNGVKTAVPNLGDIARALKRPPGYPTKFFGCELGAIAKYMEAEEKALINGYFTEKELDETLDKFIQMFVLCPQCTLPEIDIFVRKGALHYKCNACGSTGLSNNEHRSCTYMLKNPPDDTTSTMGKLKKTKEERRAMKIEKQKELEAKKNVKGTKQKAKNSTDNQGDDEADNSIEFTSIGDEDLYAVSERIRIVLLKALAITEDNMDYSKSETVDTVVKETEGMFDLINLQLAQGFDCVCAIYALCDAFFPHEKTLTFTAKQFEITIPYIRFYYKYKVKSPSVLLSALEQFAYLHNDSTVAQNYPYIVQLLFNKDILDADEIIDYYAEDIPDYLAPSNRNDKKINGKRDASANAIAAFNKFKIQIQPLLAWLKKCEETSGSETE